MNEKQRVLVLAPHTDDGELGMGGTINRFVSEGKEVYYVAFSTAQQSVPEGFPRDILSTEVHQATSVLGIPRENLIICDYEVRKLNYMRQDILEDMIRFRREINPDMVFVPCLNDIHQDHYTIAQEGVRAFKNRTLLGYELIWNNLTFHSTCFVSLSEEHIAKKCEALRQYASQGAKNYFSADFIRSLAMTRGVQAGTSWAEAFEVIRLFM